MRMAKRILFVSHSADSLGPTTSLLLLLKYLRERYDVAVLLPGYGSFTQALKQEQIPFFSLPSMNKWSIPGLLRLLRREQVSLLYGNDTSGCSRNALLAARLARVPSICHARAMGWVLSWRNLGFLKLADATIAVSEACARSISRYVSPGKLHVVHNGVVLSSREPQRNRARSRLLAETGLSSDKIVVASVSHIVPHKGQEYAIAAMSKVVTKAPSIHLLLIGGLDRSPAYVDRIRAMIREAHLSEHVSIMGLRSDADQLIRGSDLFLHTAIRDAHPRAVLEAMEAGLAVIAFSVDGVAETVKTEQTGYLVPKGDAAALANSVLCLAANAPLRMRMGSAMSKKPLPLQSPRSKVGAPQPSPGTMFGSAGSLQPSSSSVS